MVYMHTVKHNYSYILGSMFTKAQLHVSAINVVHLQVVHEELINKLYQHAWGDYSLRGGVGERSRFVLEKRGVDWGCLGNCVKVTSMSTYSYVYKWVT